MFMDLLYECETKRNKTISPLTGFSQLTGRYCGIVYRYANLRINILLFLIHWPYNSPFVADKWRVLLAHCQSEGQQILQDSWSNTTHYEFTVGQESTRTEFRKVVPGTSEKL